MRKALGATLALAIVACALPVVRAFGAPSGPGSSAARSRPAVHTGGELRIAMPDASLSVDPALVADEQNAELAGLMYQGLVRLDARYRVQPGAATYSVGRDRKTYTFHIKHGLRFSNGDPITASDFAFSINRSLDPSVKSPSAPTYLLDIQGARSVLTGKAKQASGVKVMDPYTLQITARWAVPYFLMELTYPTSYALDTKRVLKLGPVDNTTWYTAPVSSGPYRLQSWDPNNKLVLVPNKYYTGPKPSLKQVTILLSPLPDSDVYGYVSKNADIGALPSSDLTLLHLAGVRMTTMLSIDGLYMNLRSKPFSSKSVRTALTEALNRKSAVAAGFGKTATAFAGHVPPGQFGFDAGLKPVVYDPTAARDALARAGYSSTKAFPSLTLYYADDPQVARLAQAIVAQWHKNLGLTVDTKPLTLNTLLSRVQGNSLPLYLLGWSADYPDPHDWLTQQWRSDALNNNVHYQNATFDRLVETADVTWGDADRLKLYDSAQQVLTKDAAWIPLYIPHRLVYVRPGVSNVLVTGYGIIPRSGNWAQVQILPPAAQRGHLMQ